MKKLKLKRISEKLNCLKGASETKLKMKTDESAYQEVLKKFNNLV